MSDPLRNPHGAGVLDEESHGAGAVVLQLIITLHASGALSVSGAIGDKAYALALLDNAKDAIRNHHTRREGQLIVPGNDVSVI